MLICWVKKLVGANFLCFCNSFAEVAEVAEVADVAEVVEVNEIDPLV